jgi:hydrogenase maturation factor
MTATIKRSLKRRDKMKQVIEGLKLAAKYSYICERARLMKVSNDFKRFIFEETNDYKKIESILKSLISYDFYRRIAFANGVYPLDYDVVSFYWKGSPKLKGEEFIHNASTLKPIIQIRMHNIVEEMVDDCVVHPAKITSKISSNEYWVVYHPVVKTIKKDRLTLGSPREIIVQNELGLDLKEGDWVTIHFRRIIEKISKEEAQNLLKLTKTALKDFNKRNKKENKK